MKLRSCSVYIVQVGQSEHRERSNPKQLSAGRDKFLAPALEETSYTALMGWERAEIVFTEPPYNVPREGHVSGSGALKHREFAMAVGEMDRGEFTAFLEKVFGLIGQSSRAGRWSMSAWIGGTLRSFWPVPAGRTCRWSTSAFGQSLMREWEASTFLNTSSCS
jgi:hypothetical protein